MESQDILIELKKLSQNEKIKKSEIMNILKKYARTISVNDLMLATTYIRKDMEHVHANYRDKFLEIYIKYFIIRMKEVKEKIDYIDSNINKNRLTESFPLLKQTFEKEKIYDEDYKFPLIYVITSIYTTFILEEPIHPVGSEFPGNLSVEEKNGKYFCPVKENQKDNINAICHLCLAEQTPTI